MAFTGLYDTDQHIVSFLPLSCLASIRLVSTACCQLVNPQWQQMVKCWEVYQRESAHHGVELRPMDAVVYGAIATGYMPLMPPLPLHKKWHREVAFRHNHSDWVDSCKFSSEAVFYSIFWWCVEKGHIEAMSALLDIHRRIVFRENYARSGLLKSILWYEQTFGDSNWSIEDFTRVCARGELECAQYLVSQISAPVAIFIDIAARYSRDDIITWLIGNYTFEVQLLAPEVVSNSLPLLEKYDGLTEEHLTIAFRKGNHQCAQRIIEKHPHLVPHCLQIEVLGTNMETIKLYHSRGWMTFDNDDIIPYFRQCISNGLDVAQWFYNIHKERGEPIDICDGNYYLDALCAGKVDVVEWLISIDPKFSTFLNTLDIPSSVFMSGYLNVLEYLHAHQSSALHRMSYAVKWALEFDRLTVVRWVYRHYPKMLEEWFSCNWSHVRYMYKGVAKGEVLRWMNTVVNLSKN